MLAFGIGLFFLGGCLGALIALPWAAFAFVRGAWRICHDLPPFPER